MTTDRYRCTQCGEYLERGVVHYGPGGVAYHTTQAGQCGAVLLPPLKSVGDHNREVLEAHQHAQRPMRLGVACPSCGGELEDPTPNVVLPSLPPQRNTRCIQCGEKGFLYR